MKICGIYEIVGPTGRRYIGQSKDIHKRWQEHKNVILNPDRLYHPEFKRDVIEHGWDAFEFNILEETEDCGGRELYYMNEYKSHVTGYNRMQEYVKLMMLNPQVPLDYYGEEMKLNLAYHFALLKNEAEPRCDRCFLVTCLCAELPVLTESGSMVR
jgi:hypothetical protein